MKDTQIHILADSDEQEVVQQVQVSPFASKFLTELDLLPNFYVLFFLFFLFVYKHLRSLRWLLEGA